MFPHAYNFPPQTYQLGYNPWTAHAQAQFRAAAQLQQSQLAAYSVQPTLIQQAQSAAALQQQQQAIAMQAALQRNTNRIASQQPYKFQPQPAYPHHHHQHHPHHKKHYNNHRNHNHHHHKQNKNGHGLYPKTCTICNVVCNSPLQWDMHVNGKKHIKQIRGVQYQNNINNINNPNNAHSASAATKTTSVSTSTAHNSSLDSHDNNAHTNNNDTKREMIPSDQYVVEIDGNRKCALCHVEFTSAMCEISHIKGKRHQMAARGHPQHFSSKKRKHPTVSLGRCEICDVDFTSQTQKDSHLTGKKHSKNVRLVDAGQPPKKRQKTNYFSSFKKSMQPQAHMNKSRVPLPNGMNVMKFGFGGYLNNDNIKVDKLKPHQLLQLEVERIYNEYTQIAKTSNPVRAQQVYQKYQLIYDRYIKEYNLFADSFKQVQEPKAIKKEENDTKLIKKESPPHQNGVNIHKNEAEDNCVTNNDHLVPTITTISTVKEIKTETENQTNDDDDDD